MAWKIKIEFGRRVVELIERVVDQIIFCCCCTACKARIQFTEVRIDSNIIKGDIMAITITDTQQFRLTAQGVDKRGKATALDGSVEYTPSDPVLVVTRVDDLSVDVAVGDVTAVALPFSGQVTAKGDAKLGPEVVDVLGVLEVNIVASQAVNILLTPGAPSEQP